MNTLILTEEQAHKIHWNESEEFLVVQDGDWDDQGKYQHKQVVFHPVGNGTVKYALYVARSGSYYTDYDYLYELKCGEVNLVERIIQEWV